MSELRKAARWLNAHSPSGVRRIAARANWLRQSRRSSHATWEHAIPDELSHWRESFATDIAHLRWLSDPKGLVAPDSLLGELLVSVEQRELSVLDVGAGPMTPIGHVFGDKVLSITAIDSLAHAYDELLDELGITPPVRTIPGDGETLLEQFGPGAFDIAIAANALDHTYDPAAVVDAMIAVVRPGGWVLLDHHRNEAENRLYRGMHQWNIDDRGGRLVVWNPARVVDIGERLGARAREIRAYRRGDRVRAIITSA